MINSFIIVAFPPQVQSVLINVGPWESSTGQNKLEYCGSRLSSVTEKCDFIVTFGDSPLALPEETIIAPRRFVYSRNETGKDAQDFLASGLTRAIPAGSLVVCLVGSDEDPADENALEEAISLFPAEDRERFNLVTCHHLVGIRASSEGLNKELVEQANKEGAFVSWRVMPPIEKKVFIG